jgi:hypothetical protein
LGLWLLSGCAEVRLRPGGLEEAGLLPRGGAWLLLVKGQPVAEVKVPNPSRGTRVDVQLGEHGAKVTVRAGGAVQVTPVAFQLEDGSPISFTEEAREARTPRQQWLMMALAQGRYGEVGEALQDSPSEELEAVLDWLSDRALARIAESPEGRLLLVRLFDGLVSGMPGEVRLLRAWRVVATFAQLHPEESFIEAEQSPKTLRFPYRASGVTVLDSTPLSAHWLPDGRIDVQLNSRIYRTQYQEDWRTLPGLHLTLEPDEVVGVTMYDEGGRTLYVPALFSSGWLARTPCARS